MLVDSFTCDALECIDLYKYWNIKFYVEFLNLNLHYKRKHLILIASILGKYLCFYRT